MAKPNVLVLTGYGINCDEETQFAFERAGARAERVHINDLIDKQQRLKDYQILAFPGGFSYGDDTGAGNALANRIRNHLWDEVRDFVEKDNLAIGICNGFQVMTNLGLLPGVNGNFGEAQVALVDNDSAKYTDRWVDLNFPHISKSPWTKDIGEITLPIAHAEGKFYTSPEILAELNNSGLVAARYVLGASCNYQGLEANPNGSLEDVASITDMSGRLIGMMPHPERAINFTHLPNWTLLKEIYKRKGKRVPKEGPGLRIFRNGVSYFS
jgi:phosphoribosylformylglycinamidine synthase subunit PurQ / glutaminase